MRNIFFIVSLLAIVGLLSCQKEIDGTGNGPEPTPPGGKLLTKYTYQAEDVLFVDSFVYDAQGRCIKYLEKFYDSTYNSWYDWFYDFHYNGNDPYPYKITDTSQGREMQWLLEYDGQQRKTLDSIIYLNGKQVSRFANAANKLTAVTNSWSNNAQDFIAQDTFDLSGSNCTRHAGAVNVPGDPNTYWWQDLYTYDTKVNPFNKISMGVAFWFGSRTVVSGIYGFSKNNVLSMSSTSYYTPQPFVFNYQYVYDADDYPVTSYGQNPADPSIWSIEKFEYKK